MPKQIITIGTEKYPEVQALMAGQKVRLSIVGTVFSANDKEVVIQTESITAPYKSKMSTQEVLMANMRGHMEAMEKGQSKQEYRV